MVALKPSTPVTYVDTTRTSPTFETKLVYRLHEPQDFLGFNPHIADLMLAIRAGRPTVITHSTSLSTTRNRFASFSWKTQKGDWNAFWSQHDNYNCADIPDGTPVTDLDTNKSWSSDVDKLLSAIVENCHVRTHLRDGAAILSWDRASHGNTPTIILHPDDRVENYYNWPEFLPEHLEPKHTNPSYDSSPYLDHSRRPRLPEVETNHPHTYASLFADRSSFLPECQIPTCGCPADYRALDNRRTDNGPLCNYHLYGPHGYATTRQSFQKFQDWLDVTNQRISSLTALELRAEQDRAARWTHY